MTKRIFRSILLAACAVLLAALVLIMGVMYEYFTAVQQRQLASQLDLARAGLESGGEAYLQALDKTGCRLSWIGADGRVLYDSQADPASMENHADRQEVREALDTGRGESSRYSATLAEKTIYLARRLTDGTVLRVSVTHYTVVTLLLGMMQPILIVAVIAVGVSALLADRLAKRIVRPLNQLDLEQPLDNDAYEELAPLLERVERQHRQIDSQLRELERRRAELEAVTGGMREGLVLLSEKGRVLSINKAAMALLGADGGCVGRDFLTVDRDRGVSAAIDAAMSAGHGSARFERGGRQYQIDVSRIDEKGRGVGASLLIFDISEQSDAERSRREFTANVSHELKTPLQSIMGSAELLEKGLVKAEDIPAFTGRIGQEAARLVALIEDIIRLSQLDESGEIHLEPTDLKALAAEAVSDLAQAAAAKGVSVEVHGREVTVPGVRRLLYEVVYNLCDNAIRYNKEGGSVTINVGEGDGLAFLSVGDTGLGIAPEHQDRVFERFYRVDKSRSRASGGTGLGLSIVKHAVELHRGKITLNSQVGHGTEIRIELPEE